MVVHPTNAHPIIRRLPDRLHVALAIAGYAAITILSACHKQPVDSGLTSDMRTRVVLSDSDSEHLRRGMRVYLESTRGIIEALSDYKLATVQRHARKAGVSGTSDVPLWVALSAPPEFVLLGMDTHQKFDALATAAERHTTKREILQHLRNILTNCTACHATYRLSLQRRQG